MNTYLEDYLTMLRVEKSLSKKSIDAYRNDLTRYLEFLTENQLLNNLTEIRQIHIREYIRFISDLEFQPTTIRRNFSSIQSYHKFLSSEKLLSTNPSQIIDPPKLPKRIPETLSVTEIDAIINVVNLKDPMGYRDKAILEVLYSAGLRVTELCDLLLPRKILPDKPFLKVYGKKDKERLVPIGQKAIDSINSYKRKIRYKQVERFKKKEKEIQHLFLSKNCWRLTRMTVNNIVKKWSQAAGITKKVYPHIFRHSFATHLIDGGANIIQIQMMLGHADVSTTQIYTHHDTLFKTSQLEQFHPRW